MKKLAAFIFGLLISLSFYADARLVSGTAQHQHDSATGGGATINNTSIGSNSKIAPSIYAYDSAAPSNEKYYKFGNASGDFVLFTYDDTPAAASTVFSITRTGTTPNSFDLGAVSLTSSKACATNYVRVSPNLCMATDAVLGNGAGVPTTCTAMTLPASGIKAVIIRLSLTVTEGGALGDRYNYVQYYDSGCSTKHGEYVARARENPAGTNGNVLLQEYPEVTVPTIGGSLYHQQLASGGISTGAGFIIRGYYD